MCQNAKTFWFGTAYFDGIWASKSKFQGKHHPLLVKSSSSFHSSLMGPTRCQKGLPTNSCPPSTHPPALVVGALFGNSWNPSWWVTKNCYFPLDKGNSYFFACWKSGWSIFFGFSDFRNFGFLPYFSFTLFEDRGGINHLLLSQLLTCLPQPWGLLWHGQPGHHPMVRPVSKIE